MLLLLALLLHLLVNLDGQLDVKTFDLFDDLGL